MERFPGDGIMIIFNDPIPFPDHAERAVRMALDMREQVEQLAAVWRRQGHELGFGIGIATGYATLGQIGFEQRREYTVIGSVTNLASRLCDEARPGQIVIDQRAFGLIEQSVESAPLKKLRLKGFNRPISAHEVLAWRAPPRELGPAGAECRGRGSRAARLEARRHRGRLTCAGHLRSSSAAIALTWLRA